MRQWTKYEAVPWTVPAVSNASNAEDYFAQMGGYHTDDAYQTPSAFFAKHLYADPRLLAYDRFLQGRVRNGERILSVASGRCVNELQLMKMADADVVCSELSEPPCLGATRAIFPDVKFLKLDVLNDDPPGIYESVLSLSLIYAFDDAQLLRFFRFVSRALKPGGRLLLDLASSPDSLVTWLLHDVFLPAEAALLAGYLTLKLRTPHKVQVVPHGYRRSIEDVARVAREVDLELVDVQLDCFDIELSRSVLLRRLQATAVGAMLLAKLRPRIPYVRMAEFVFRPSGGGEEHGPARLGLAAESGYTLSLPCGSAGLKVQYGH